MALSFTLRVAVRLPVAVGLNVTLIVQCDFAAKLLLQVLVWAKSAGSAPVNVMLLIAKAVDKLLVNVTFFGALLVPTFCAAKVNEAEETTACETPVPDSDAV